MATELTENTYILLLTRTSNIRKILLAKSQNKNKIICVYQIDFWNRPQQKCQTKKQRSYRTTKRSEMLTKTCRINLRAECNV
jgi:hypothetical protein